jgi:hypothetical protein
MPNLQFSTESIRLYSFVQILHNCVVLLSNQAYRIRFQQILKVKNCERIDSFISLIVEDGGNTFLQNAGKHLQNHTSEHRNHRRRLNRPENPELKNLIGIELSQKVETLEDLFSNTDIRDNFHMLL